jgi:hypothetical protein
MRVAKIDHNLRKEIDWYINKVPNYLYFRGFEGNLKKVRFSLEINFKGSSYCVLKPKTISWRLGWTGFATG